MIYRYFLKRIFDIFFSFLGLIVLSPVFLLISILIKLSSKGPVFFRHERVGRNFQLFKLLKFRSMVLDADKKGLAITSSDDSRITRIGRFLRRTKLDELPQLWNVLIGEISFVGPRPESPKYVELKKKDYEEILKIKPGITDYAAIEFSKEEEVLAKYDDKEKAYIDEVLPKKIELYKRYIQDMGFWTDIGLILRTIF